jgi:hypothetical protein
MMPASELKVTRVISTPRILNRRDYEVSGLVKTHPGEKALLRTCGDIIESDDSDERQKGINEKQRDFPTRAGE